MTDDELDQTGLEIHKKYLIGKDVKDGLSIGSMIFLITYDVMLQATNDVSDELIDSITDDLKRTLCNLRGRHKAGLPTFN